MATQIPFTGIVPADDSELDSVLDSKLNIASKTKPLPADRYTSTVAPIVEEKLVKIDDELFQKILFFTLFYPLDESYIKEFFWMSWDSEYKLFKEITPMFYYNKNRKAYYKIIGFLETIFVFYHYLKTINFNRIVKDSTKIYNFSKYKFVQTHSDYDSNTEYNFMFNIKNTELDPISLGSLDTNGLASLDTNKLFGYIKLSSEHDKDFSTGIDIYITQPDFNRLSNYVALLEKLIDEEIVIELRDGDLFVDDIKIGYKSGCIKSIGNAIGNAIRKTCRDIFTRATTIGFEDNPKKVFYDTIFSIYTNEKLIAIVDRKLHQKSAGGRNNKTRKRHRNKASHKKIRKSHNIRKRKATGKKRK